MGYVVNACRFHSFASQSIVALRDQDVLRHKSFWSGVNALTDVIACHPAQRWALVCEDGDRFAAGFLALANSGRTIVVPQAPQAGSLGTPGERVDAVLTDRPEQFSGFKVLSAIAPVGTAIDAPQMPDDRVRIEFYTSGSTGAPQCVPKLFVQLRHEVEVLERQWGALLADAVVAGTVPHYHLYGLLFRILWPLLTGRAFLARMCLHPTALRAATEYGKCVIVSSPAFLGRIANFAALPPAGQVQAVFSSGAALADSPAEGLARDWGHAAIEVYGSTESGGIAWRAWAGHYNRALWEPIHGVETALRQEPAGARLWVRSGCTWQGDWIPTGDLAHRQDDGRFVLLGRADGVVKYEDKRVSLDELRRCLMTHDWVSDAHVLLLSGNRTQIGAVVILNEQGRSRLAASGKGAIRESLRVWLRRGYEQILIPRKWRFLDELPGNVMGKVEYARLQRLFEKQP